MVFRADASMSIGTGHVMRSSALAEEAIYQEIPCVFIGDLGDVNWLKERIRKLGFAEIYQDETLFVPNAKSDILIIDSYNLDPDNKFFNSENWHYIVNIADEVTPEYTCNLLIHPGLDESWMAQKDVKVLSGPKYILIRKSVRKLQTQVKSYSNELKLLVAAGGSDPYGFSIEIAKVIDSLDLDITVHFFTNERIRSLSGKNFIIHQFGPDFDKVAEQVDVVISTASTTCLEFMSREIPMGLVSAVENQMSYYKELTARELALPLGYFKAETGWNLNKENIWVLLNSKRMRKKLSEKMRGVIDHSGAKRIISFVESEINGK